MDKDLILQKSKGSKARKALLVAGNVLLVALILLLCLQHVNMHQNENRQAAVESFAANVSAMRSVAATVLSSSQQSCRDKASYIDVMGMSLQEALSYLAASNSEDGVSYHILDYETLQGYSSVADQNGETAVDYASFASAVTSAAEAARARAGAGTDNEDSAGDADAADEAAETDTESGSEDEDTADAGAEAGITDEITITASYTNPITHFQSIGFAEDIVLTAGPDKAQETAAETDGDEADSPDDPDAVSGHYLLLRVVATQAISGKWIFPSEYVDCELSLIAASGSYIIRTPSMKSENFWEFVRIYNGVGYDGAEAIKNSFYSGETSIMELKDAAGRDCYAVCQPFRDGSTDMYFVAWMPVGSLNVSGVDFTLVIIVAVGMLLILLLNSLYILDMNRRLRRTSELALEASRAKTDFLSSMSHDIRTPMNAIIGMTSIASRHTDDPQRVDDCLSKISLASNHLLTLINDILDISKIESGRLPLNPSVFSLADLINEELNIVQPQIRDKELDLEVQLEGVEHEHLYADELRLKQIFINLLSNAVKYTEQGGHIFLSLRQEPDEQEPGKVRLTYSVQDDGIGMTPEFMKVMFEPFSRMADSRRDQTQGTGLGLAITRRMVDLMGGQIECQSQLGEGSTFTVYLTLPLAEKDSENLKLTGRQVLLVDDDESFMTALSETCASLELTADQAADGMTAVEMVRERHEQGAEYDAVLIDWRMPGQSTPQTIQEIRKIVGTQVPVIIVSAYDWGDIEDEARGAGADAFLSKPVFRSSLYAKLSELLQLQDQGGAAEEEDISEGLQGLHLLVAEDNDMNWEIIHELLSMYDITADRAVNGEEAVQMLTDAADDQYAAILMDVQMPVMNGREATVAIRKMDDAKKKQIPIIAMTADAFAEDIQACLEAGMNAHTAKPVDMKKLFTALRDVLRKKA